MIAADPGGISGPPERWGSMTGLLKEIRYHRELVASPTSLKRSSESRALRFLRFPTRRFRERRMSEFLNVMRPAAGDRILDVGGTALNWNLVGYSGPVVLANIVPIEHVGAMPANIEYVHADGTNLPFGDGEFSIASRTPSSSTFTRSRSNTRSRPRSDAPRVASGFRRPRGRSRSSRTTSLPSSTTFRRAGSGG